MSFVGLVHTCTIRRSSRALDAAGESIDSMSDLATGVACRFYRPDAKELVATGGQVVVTHRLMLPYGQDVHEKDVVTAITDNQGTVLASEAAVNGVYRDPAGQRHHMECDLTEVRTF